MTMLVASPRIEWATESCRPNHPALQFTSVRPTSTAIQKSRRDAGATNGNVKGAQLKLAATNSKATATAKSRRDAGATNGNVKGAQLKLAATNSKATATAKSRR